MPVLKILLLLLSFVALADVMRIVQGLETIFYAEQKVFNFCFRQAFVELIVKRENVLFADSQIILRPFELKLLDQLLIYPSQVIRNLLFLKKEDLIDILQTLKRLLEDLNNHFIRYEIISEGKRVIEKRSCDLASVLGKDVLNLHGSINVHAFNAVKILVDVVDFELNAVSVVDDQVVENYIAVFRGGDGIVS